MSGPWQRWFAWYPVRTEQHGWRPGTSRYQLTPTKKENNA